MYSVTIFKNTFDNKTHRRVIHDSWDAFERMFLNLSKKKGNKGGNNSSPLISPAIYHEGGTRSNKNVVEWGHWCAMDIDEFDPLDDLSETLQHICGEYKFICYSTASSTPKQPKFRLVFPTTTCVTAENIPHFWYALNERFKALGGDEQTKDLSRMYYVPAQYPDALNFYFTNDGKDIDPTELMEAYPYSKPSGDNFLDRLPDSMKEEILNYRKSKLSRDVSWTSYRNCPFFPRQLGVEYMTITKTGWYSKLYQIMIAIAGNALKKSYDITAKEIADMCRELDNETGQWYDNRPLEREADRAIEYIYKNL
tara:strand:+ start:2648 stop:3577 length:930 start_codon:yes stop_codon:yes gene_type:complete